MIYNDDNSPIVERIKFRNNPNSAVEIFVRESKGGFVASYVAWASGQAFVSGASCLDDIPPYRSKCHAVAYGLNAVRSTVCNFMKERIPELEIMERNAVQQPRDFLWPDMAMRGEQLELAL